MNKPLIATVGLFEKAVQKKKGRVDEGEKQDARVTSSAELVAKLKNAQKVMIVPGYGLAVSKGQYTLASLIESLRKDGNLPPFMPPLDPSLESHIPPSGISSFTALLARCTRFGQTPGGWNIGASKPAHRAVYSPDYAPWMSALVCIHREKGPARCASSRRPHAWAA